MSLQAHSTTCSTLHNMRIVLHFMRVDLLQHIALQACGLARRTLHFMREACVTSQTEKSSTPLSVYHHALSNSPLRQRAWLAPWCDTIDWCRMEQPQRRFLATPSAATRQGSSQACHCSMSATTLATPRMCSPTSGRYQESDTSSAASQARTGKLGLRPSSFGIKVSALTPSLRT